MQIKHIYVTVCHIVHNELSEKAKYLCYCQTKPQSDVNMFNLHIKQTEISEKRSKVTKNVKRCYFVILSALLNKANHRQT